MRSYRNYYHHRIYRAIHSDFWRLEFAIWLQTLAWSMIAIFVPILMLRYGYSLQAVLIYEAVFFGADVPINFLARKLVLVWGAREVTMAGLACAVIFAACFHYLSFGGYPILLGLALILAVFDAFYWVGHYYLFIESSGKPESAGRSTGIVNGVRIFGGMLGPAIGAGILVLGGQDLLLTIGALIFALSLIPLFSLNHVRNRPSSAMPLREFIRERREKLDYLSFGLYCIHAAAEDPIWSIFIFVVLGTLNSVALLAVVVSLSTVIVSYFAGVITRENAPKLVLVGSVCAAVVWILRLTFPNGFVYYASVLFIGFFAILVSVPIESRIVERGRIKDALWASTLRNAVSMFTPFLLFAVLIPIVSVFKVSFVVAALSLFVLIIIVRFFGAAAGKDVEVPLAEEKL